ncbi:uncharacterized protein LOC130893270 [Diorhabda carinulata]|uniref:uncharacterized protein LOC130893270 n=1 Tax=Diorhabda carinulata TaxID=1163345 RepID=UPI0025A1F168|nr:uncharacterized protein LOC130893270 [Diorhabda carinulata]
MKIQIWVICFISAINLITCGYLINYHPLPPNLITSSTVIGSTAGVTPSSGSYSASQLTQTILNSPHRIQSPISPYHPSNYDGRINQDTYSSGSNERRNQSRYLSQFTPNRFYNPSQTTNYNTNHPSAVTYNSYDNERPGNNNLKQEVYYQRENIDDVGHVHDAHNNYEGY